MFKWINKALLNGIFDLFFSFFLFLKFGFSVLKESKKDWKKTIELSYIEKENFIEEKKKNFTDVTSNLSKDDFTKSAKNIMFFSLFLWILTIIFLIQAILTFSYAHLFFVFSLFILVFFGLGYPILMVQTKMYMNYSEFLNLIRKKSNFKHVFPLFKI